MAAKTIIFDLDGTLTDSGEGIFACAEEVLRHFRLPIPPRQELRWMIGPPLKYSFAKLGVKPEDVDEAVQIYRQHYNNGGIFMNFPYPGIPELLAQLHSLGHTICLATSKPDRMAHIVLDHFHLSPYFHHICCASEDNKRSTKEEVIAYLLEQVDGAENLIMVGDTIYDVKGASHFGIPAIGVSWGYGNTEEMRSGGAIAIAEHADELLRLLLK